MSKEKLKPCLIVHTCVGQLDGLCTISHNEHYRKPCPKSLKEYRKSCPFCGGEATISKIKDFSTSDEMKRTTYTVFVGCKKCHAWITSGYSKIAIKAWNRRAK